MSILVINENTGITELGGIAVRMINKTGSNSVSGELVEADTTTDNAFDQNAADGDHPIGAVYDGGVPDGSDCWVVVAGVAEVLLKDSTASTHGYWAATADVAGRADCTSANPPGVVAAHFQEIGHCIETKTGGTNVKAKIVLHFN